MSSTHDQTLAQLNNRLNAIVSLNASEELVRAEDLGTANFEGAVPIVEKTIALFRDIYSSDLSVFPLQILQTLVNQADGALRAFDDIRNFALEHQGNPIAARDNLIVRLENEYDQHFLQLEPHVNYLLAKQTDLGAIEAKARTTMQDLEEFAAGKRSEQEAVLDEMEATLSTVRAAAAEVGVGQQSIVFGKQADKDGSTARGWLISAIALGLVSLGYLVVIVFALPPAAQSTGEVVREIGGRFVILTLFAFALGFTVRQYASSKHNETVNLHRQNALRTFETFVSATHDDETKDAVLLEATRSIFAAQPSGFLRSGKEAESPSTIIEVIRRISSTSET